MENQFSGLCRDGQVSHFVILQKPSQALLNLNADPKELTIA